MKSTDIAKLVLALFAAYASYAGAENRKPTWKAQMGELSKALADTIPYLYPDPSRDSKELTVKVKRIYDVTQNLEGNIGHASAGPDHDPALRYIAGLLVTDVARAYHALQDGNVEYGKGEIRSSVSYCLACHSRSQVGSEFPLIGAFAEPLKRASWIEKIEFQAASRQIEPVLTEVMQQLDKPGVVGLSPLDLERGARIALSIAIRIKRDPARARFLAESVLKSPSASFSMKQAARTWTQDISEWQGEKKTQLNSDKDLIEAARKLIAESEKREGPIGGNSEVKFLRASYLMHDLLKGFPQSAYAAEAMYIEGLSYDALQELGLWSLHEMYYLACIDKTPHSAQAEKCYKKYEESTVLGYTGSSGTHLPKAMTEFLKNLEMKAKLKTP